MSTQTIFSRLNNQAKKDLIQFTIDKLNEIEPNDIYGCDLHNYIFNQDYYIIGRYEAEQFLNNTGIGIFGAIGEIQDYEQSNFGQVTTNLTEPENVANMLVYILGEEILQESQHLNSCWNDYLSNGDLQTIIEEIENI